MDHRRARGRWYTTNSYYHYSINYIGLFQDRPSVTMSELKTFITYFCKAKFNGKKKKKAIRNWMRFLTFCQSPRESLMILSEALRGGNVTHYYHHPSLKKVPNQEHARALHVHLPAPGGNM